MSFPNQVKVGGTLDCDMPNLAVVIDTSTPSLILTDKDKLGDIDTTSPGPFPATPANCTETTSSGSVSGTGMFQQLKKSGTINSGGGNGPSSVPSGLKVTSVPNGDGTTTYILRFYVDDRSQTDEVDRYQITFDDPQNNDLCDDGNGSYFDPCVHKMGLPDPNLGEDEVTKGSVEFPQTSSFDQYVIEEISVTVDDTTLQPVANTDFAGRWCHNGTENGNDLLTCDFTDDTGKGKPQNIKLRTDAETALDIFVTFLVNPKVTVTNNSSGSTPTYVLTDDNFDATTITATSISVDGTTVNCANTTTTDINGDGKDDWKCSADTAQFVSAAGLQSCLSSDTEWTAEFAVQVFFDGKQRTARDKAATFPINCNK